MSTKTGIFYFGRAPLAGAIISWGARAIFHPSNQTMPLDLLWDRQQFTHDGKPPEFVEQFRAVINSGVLAGIQKLAGFFNTDSGGEFIQHHEWPADPALVVVASGSPNSSYGYFYLVASLVPRDQAPPEIRPDIEAARRKVEADRQWAQLQARWAEEKKAARARNKLRRVEGEKKTSEFRAKGTGRRAESGQVLELGDSLVIQANQAQRDAIVIAVTPTSALIEYIMPRGRAFKWEVNRTTHAYIRNISAVPKRFQP